MRMNATRDDAIRPNGAEIGEVEVFTYLGAKMSTTEDSKVENRAWLSNASLNVRQYP